MMPYSILWLRFVKILLVSKSEYYIKLPYNLFGSIEADQLFGIQI